MRTSLAALLLVFTAVTASAAPTEEHWLQVRSDHFTVISDGTEKEARRTATEFERMRMVFTTLIPTAASGASAPITVVAVKDQKDFRSIEPAAYLGKGQLELAGLFLTTGDGNYILVRLDTAGQEHPYSTVYHEYTHFLNRKAEWLPLWLNEGLAEFYQNTDIEDKTVRLGQASVDDIMYLRQNSLIPVSTLFAVDHNSPYYHEEQKGSIFYAESWALTHYLLVNDTTHGTHRVRDYAQNLVKGEDPTTAAQNAFGDLGKLNKALSSYVEQAAFNEFRIPMSFDVDPSQFHVEPISTPGANAVRADVLAHEDRRPDARALLQATLRDDPNSALAHETMGFLEFQEGDTTAALKWYDEAVKLQSQSYLAQYYAAVLAMRGDDGNNAAIESGLRASIKLNSSFAPAYDALAKFYTSHHEKLDDARMLEIQAVEREPEEISYRINASNVLMEQNRPADAINILKAAERVTKDPSQLAILQNRIKDVEHYQAAVEKAQAEAAAAGSSVSVTTAISTTSSTAETVTTNHGRLVVEKGDTEPRFPTAAATGPHRSIKGIVRDVKCYYPAVLSLVVEPARKDPSTDSAKPVRLYMNSYYKVDFYTLNFQPVGDLKPCTDIEGMKVNIDYAEITDPSAAGEILKVELSK